MQGFVVHRSLTVPPVTAVSGLAVAVAPDVAHYFPFFLPMTTGNQLAAGIATCLAPAIAATLFIAVAYVMLHRKSCPLSTWFVDTSRITETAQSNDSVSVSGSQLIVFKTMFWVFTAVASVWLIATGAVLFSMRALSMNSNVTHSIANGAIYMSAFAMVLVLNVAVIFPGLLMLQPIRLWKVIRAEKAAVTPRQRFRGTSSSSCCDELAAKSTPSFSCISSHVRPVVRYQLLCGCHHLCICFCFDLPVARTCCSTLAIAYANWWVVHSRTILERSH